MTREVVESILSLNKKSYQTIASKFSQTRQQPWDDFSWLDKEVQEGVSVLEIGCGNGRLFEYLAPKNIAYTGIDLSTNFVHIANERYGKHKLTPKFISGDVLALDSISELKNKHFDIIIGVAVLCHLPKPVHTQAIQQIKGFLAPNGEVVLYNWNLWRPSLREKTVWKGVKERIFMKKNTWLGRYGLEKASLRFKDVMTVWQSGPAKAPLYYYAFTVNELKSLFMSNGLAIKNIFYTKKGIKAHWWKGGNIYLSAKLD